MITYIRILKHSQPVVMTTPQALNELALAEMRQSNPDGAIEHLIRALRLLSYELKHRTSSSSPDEKPEDEYGKDSMDLDEKESRLLVPPPSCVFVEEGHVVLGLRRGGEMDIAAKEEEHQCNTANRATATEGSESSCVSSFFFDQIKSSRSPASHNECQNYSEEEDGPRMYPSPMRLLFHTPPHGATINHEHAFAYIDLQSYCNIYNLALVHHIKGLAETCPQNRRLSLAKALSLYEKAHQLLVGFAQGEDKISQDKSASQAAHSIAITHSMVLLNNIGHIHSQLDSQREASACFVQLLSTLMYVVDSRQVYSFSGTRFGEYPSRTQMDLFCSNVVPYLNPEKAKETQSKTWQHFASAA